MLSKRNLLLILTIAFSITILGCSKSTPEGHFTGDLSIQSNESTIMGTIYHTAEFYRIDLFQEGSEYYFTVFPDSSLVRLFVPEKKEYYEINIGGYNVFRNDPFQDLGDLILSNFREVESTDTLNGYVCDKTVISKDDQKISTYWLSQKFNFPLKIIFHEDNRTVGITNIKETEVKNELFGIPEGYQLLTP